MHSPISHAICGAKKRNGEPCKTRPMPNGRCRMHGGNQKSGIASVLFKTGRYSKHLPSRLSERYEASLADPDLIAGRDAAALLDARVEDLLARVDSGESGELWRSIRQTYAAAEDARKDMERCGDSSGLDFLKARQAFFDAYDSIGTLIAEGAMDYHAWDEVLVAMEAKRKIDDTETKRLKEAQKSITVERAMTLVGALTGIVTKYVTDRDTLGAISTELRAIIHGGAG